MNELETYIRAHAAQFDTEAPASGHEERFLALVDATGAAQAESDARPDGRKSRISFRSRPLRYAALALALCAAAFLLLRPGDPFRGTGNDPEAIYLAYMDQLAGLYSRCPAGDSAGRDAVLAGITEELTPLFAELPDELPARERARVLKSYYGELLAAARQINNTY